MIANAFVAGYDLKTGKDILDNAMAVGDGAFECFIYGATKNYFISNYHIFTDLKGTVPADQGGVIVRPTCWGSYTPANGMLYCPAGNNTSGLEYHLMTHTALARVTPAPAVDDAKRLEKNAGPVGGRPSVWPAADEWPVYLGNAMRSRSTPGAAPDALDVLWRRDLETPNRRANSPVVADWNLNDWIAGCVTAPTVAGGLAVIAVPDGHRVDALDAKTGAPKWSFATPARVDSAPTLYGGLCLFGCNDGYVYAVRGDTGQLAWRFLAAPADRSLVAFGQLESTNPVHGSVLVHDGGLYVQAGRSTDAAPGTRVYRLDPLTGEVKWSKTLDSKMVGQPSVGLMKTDGKVVSANFAVFDAATGAVAKVTTDKGAAPTAGGRRVRIITPRSQEKAYMLGELHSDRMPLLEWYTEDTLNKNGGCMAARIARDDARLVLLSPGGRAAEKDVKLGLYALDADGNLGDAVWKLDEKAAGDGEFTRFNGLALTRDHVIVTANGTKTKKGVVMVFTAKDGKRVASQTLDAGIINDGLAVAGGQLVVTCLDGSVVCLGRK